MDIQNQRMKLLAQTLNDKRLELGYSYRTLADETGIAHTSIQRYLLADRDMPLPSFEKIAQALGLSPWRTLKNVEDSITTNAEAEARVQASFDASVFLDDEPVFFYDDVRPDDMEAAALDDENDIEAEQEAHYRSI